MKKQIKVNGMIEERTEKESLNNMIICCIWTVMSRQMYQEKPSKKRTDETKNKALKVEKDDV